VGDEPKISSECIVGDIAGCPWEKVENGWWKVIAIFSPLA
jgi:hypothetical protein